MKNSKKIVIMLIVLITCLNCSNDDDTPIVQNNDPVIVDQNFTVAENIADNIPIGTVAASDPDGDTLKFSISVNDGNLFEISEEGVLSLDDLQVLDFETVQSHTITIAVNDGSSTVEAMITIIVTNVDDTSFITTWQTTSSNEIVSIPTMTSEFTYDYTINWGDGTIQSGRTGDVSHTYTNPGTYTVSISGIFPAIVLSDNVASQGQLRSVEQWGTIQWLSMKSAFQGVSMLSINATDVPDLSQVTDMSAMFLGINTLSPDLNSWDVSNVTDMSFMFGNSQFNKDISNWDVSNVTNMRAMFSNSIFNQDISSWNVSNVTDMGFMFNNSPFNQDISNWDVSNVTDMRFMFSNSPFNQDIGNWDVSNVTDMRTMFRNSPFNQDIGNWNVSNVTNMGSLFRDTSFNRDIGNWNVSNVTEMFAMFRGSSFNQNISGWNVTNALSMGSMFRDTPFNQDISDWDVNNVTFCNDFATNSPLTIANTPDFTSCTP